MHAQNHMNTLKITFFGGDEERFYGEEINWTSQKNSTQKKLDASIRTKQNVLPEKCITLREISRFKTLSATRTMTPTIKLRRIIPIPY